jgi:antitoxin ParD1/3/4
MGCSTENFPTLKFVVRRKTSDFECGTARCLDKARTACHEPDSQNCAIHVIRSLGSQECAIMNVSIGERWQGFVDRVVKDGRYGSASEVVREGLRLVEEREAKLLALRATLNASIAGGGEVTDAELEADLAAHAAELRSQGRGP